MLVSITLYVTFLLLTLEGVQGFVFTSSSSPSTTSTTFYTTQTPRQHEYTYNPLIVTPKSKLFLHNPQNESNDNDDNPKSSTSTSSSIVSRFTSPKIDDAGLPISDALIAQIVAPTLQVFWLSANHAPIPTWLKPSISTVSQSMLYNVPTQGSLVAPTLIHGAGLACCWILGALASKGFESDAFNVSGGRGYSTVISRIVQAGAFAIGVLIFATQIDLFIEFGFQYVQPGDSNETDVRLLSAYVEIINDVFFEGVVLLCWRLYRASLTNDPSGRPPNYEP